MSDAFSAISSNSMSSALAISDEEGSSACFSSKSKTNRDKLYPNLPSAPPENPQVAYHLSIIQVKMQGLKNKEQTFKQNYEKYTKILNRLTWLNACSSRISVATGISSVATFATFVGLPVSVALGAASMTGVITSGIISTLTKKYQKKLKKVTPHVVMAWVKRCYSEKSKKSQ